MTSKSLSKTIFFFLLFQLFVSNIHAMNCSSMLNAEKDLFRSENQIAFSGVHVLNELIVPEGDDNRYTLQDHYDGKIVTSLSFVKWVELPAQEGLARIVGLTQDGKLYFLAKKDRNFASKAKRIYFSNEDLFFLDKVKDFRISSKGALMVSDLLNQTYLFSYAKLLEKRKYFTSRKIKFDVLRKELGDALGYGISIATAFLLVDQYPDLVSRLIDSSPYWLSASAGLGLAKGMYRLNKGRSSKNSGFIKKDLDFNDESWFEGGVLESSQNKNFFEHLSDMQID